MKSKLSLALVALLAAVVMSPLAARADAFLTGGFSKSGSVVPVNGATGVVTTLGSATGLDFNSAGTTPTPGVAGTFIVTSTSGDFLALLPLGTVGLVKDFTFTGAGSANYPNTPISTFEVAAGVTFDLTSVGVTFHDLNSLVLDGAGIFHAAGFADTPGDFHLSAQQGGGTFSFSASQGTTPTPEPASLLLLSSGLLGFTGVIRRKLNW